jgi:hypothetical protein
MLIESSAHLRPNRPIKIAKLCLKHRRIVCGVFPNHFENINLKAIISISAITINHYTKYARRAKELNAKRSVTYEVCKCVTTSDS